MRPVTLWLPAAILGVGACWIVGVDLQRALPLRAALGETIPQELAQYVGTDLTLSAAEVRVAGVTTYLLRSYRAADSAAAGAPFSLYVGYYDSQTQGKTIHSPKNCLPGAGWEALASSRVAVDAPTGRVRVNKYLLQRKSALALVLYWYQGRGRVASSEYGVKWDLLRDAALRQRSEEALVRIVVPITESEEAALAVATEAAAAVIPAVFAALPSS
jgi:EpsI family protein